jgi:hypothetical protein
MSSNELSEAARAFTRVVALEGESPLGAQAHYSLAGLYRKQGKAAESEDEMNEFRRLQAKKGPAQEPAQKQ